MATIVMKFGGDALGDKGKGAKRSGEEPLHGATFHPDKFQHAARIIARAHQRGDRVAVVVSAMGDSTNRLLAMANSLMQGSPARELDMLMATGEQQSIALLAIALHAEGLQAVSLTGTQIGLVTSQIFGKARIQTMDVERLRKALDDGAIPVIAGFQGVTIDAELTTLGRGGSDITAVAVAAAIRADLCEFYKDVDGIYTTDPRVCPTAKLIERISYDEMLELASMGAGVLHSRSIEFAKNYKVVLHVRSYLHERTGTFVVEEDGTMEDVVVSGIAFNRTEARITLRGVPDRPGVAAELFSAIGEGNIIVDMIIQSAGREGRNDISFTVSRADFDEAMRITREENERIGALEAEGDLSVAKISVVGVGMKSHYGVAAKMFQALAAAGINIQMISTSEIKISCIISEEQLEDAVRTIHRAFEDETRDARPN